MRLVSTIGLLVIAWGLHGQDSTFSADVRVVNLLATVRDRDGRFVKGLTKEDFALHEEGRPQQIGYFIQESNPAVSDRLARGHELQSITRSGVGAIGQL